MRVLRVQQLASELDLLPGDLNVMITLGRMAALAQTIHVQDSSSAIEIGSASEEYAPVSARDQQLKQIELALQDYFYVNGLDNINLSEIADLCLTVIESTPRIS